MEHLAARGLHLPDCRSRNRAGEALGDAGRPAGGDRHLPRGHVGPPAAARALRAPSATALAGLAPRRRGLCTDRGRNALSVARLAAALRAARPTAPTAVIAGPRQRRSPASSPILEAHWPSNLPAGVIHADLFPDNVFFLRNRLSGLIDFYFACNDILAYDPAICLNAWCFEPDGALNVTKARALLGALSAAGGRFTAAEIAALPLLARGSALRFLLTRLYDWLNVPPGALVAPKDPLGILAQAPLPPVGARTSAPMASTAT